VVELCVKAKAERVRRAASVDTAVATRTYSVTKRPLGKLPAEQRAKIAAELLEGYGTGEEIADLAPNYGISDVTAYALLIRDHEEEWKQAQIARALARKAQVSNDLSELRTQLRDAETALDALSLTRIQHQIRLAEVQAKRAEWELEKVYRRVYGQDAPEQGSRVAIQINLGTNDAQQQSAIFHSVEQGKKE
jgi:hypothetical protein